LQCSSTKQIVPHSVPKHIGVEMHERRTLCEMPLEFYKILQSHPSVGVVASLLLVRTTAPFSVVWQSTFLRSVMNEWMIGLGG